MPVPATFKAAVLHESGARHTIEERSLGPLEPGEIAVKITATAINPIDWKIRDLGWWIKEYPTVLGSDAAGEVAELGPDVSSVKVGDRVFFQGIIGSVDHSTFQQYARIPAALVSKTPPISDEAAAGVHLATMAALTGFYDSSGRGLPAPWDHDGDRVGNDKAIIILGGSSSVGQYAIQLAGRSGYELIVTNASATHKELLTKLGTNVVLERSPKAGANAFRDALGEIPLDFVFDAISSAETQKLGVEILQAAGPASGRQLVTVLEQDAEALALARSQEPAVEIKHVVGLGSAPNLRYLSEPFAKHIGGPTGWIGLHLFRPNSVTVVEGGLAKLDEALDKNKRGVSGEKVVIRPWDE